jgi:hypothetical protein
VVLLCCVGKSSARDAMCVRGKRGPACKDHAACDGISGCLRCARSGFCTAEPIAGSGRQTSRGKGKGKGKGQKGGEGASVCMKGQRGPACKSNGECQGIDGCLRCARSGYCTDVPMPHKSPKMDCGAGVRVCGVLALQSGLGRGVYGGGRPAIHGLWPQENRFGTSECIAPSVSSNKVTKVYSCYEDSR